MQDERISLYFREGNSDKEYHAQLEAQDEGFVVRFQYGRRGAALTAGTKTARPLDYAGARKVYDKLVREKLAKGYTEGESGERFQAGALEARFTGIVPQLLNPVDASEAERLLDDDAWVLQEKYDGQRRLARIINETREAGETGACSVTGVNRRGLTVALPEAVARALAGMHRWAPLTIDGELVGEQLVVFDVLEFEGRDLRAHSQELRWTYVERVRDAMQAHGATAAVAVAWSCEGAQAKREAYLRLKREGKEGVVFKRRGAAYAAGRPNSGGPQRKRKFVHSATLVVEAANPGKRSVALVGLDAEGTPVRLGNVTIPPNHAVPAAGALVEVEYLYAYPGGSLYQPQYRGERDDLERAAATTAQLHFKRVGAEDDEDTEGQDRAGHDSTDAPA